MIGKVLKKETCAKCGFCCSFRRQSLWELPRLSVEFAEKHPVGTDGNRIDYKFDAFDNERFAVFDLEGKYLTKDPEEEVRCPFLDPDSGCVLSKEDKPFDCGIWPVRYMKMPDGTDSITLASTCPAMDDGAIGRMKELTETGLGERIREHAAAHPYMVRDYRKEYIVIEEK